MEKIKSDQQRGFYTVEEAADELGVHMQTVRNCIRDGRIKSRLEMFNSRRQHLISIKELEKARKLLQPPGIDQLRKDLTEFMLYGGSDVEAADLAARLAIKVKHDLAAVSCQVQSAARLHASLRVAVDKIGQVIEEYKALAD